MQSRNPLTNKVEANVYLSDILSVEKRIATMEGSGGGEALEIAERAKATAQEALDKLNAPQTGVVAKAAAAESGAAQLESDYQSLNATAQGYNDLVFGENGVVAKADELTASLNSAETVAVNVEKALVGSIYPEGPTFTNSILDCFVETSIHLADLDLLKEVGEAAHELHEVNYPFSHITAIDNSIFSPSPSNYTDGPSGTGYEPGPSGYSLGPVVDYNFMSVQCADPAMLSGVVEWKSDLPSLTTTELDTADSKIFKFTSSKFLASFTGSLPNLVTGREMFMGLGCCFTEGPSALPNLVDGTDMFNGCKKLPNAPTELPSLVDGTRMYYDIDPVDHPISKFFEGPTLMPNLVNGTDMFRGSVMTPPLPVSLPSLVNGTGMYAYVKCSEYTAGPTDYIVGPSGFSIGPRFLPYLEDGTEMFLNLHELNTMPEELPMLENGTRMYAVTDLDYFSNTPAISGPALMPSIINGTEMFKGRSSMVSCPEKLDSLVTGTSMFEDCHSLVDGPKSLRNLQQGVNMFKNCPLSLQSFKGILQTLPTSAGGSIFLGGVYEGIGERSCLTLSGATYSIKQELVEALNAAKEIWTITVGFYTPEGDQLSLIPQSSVTNIPAGISYQS